MRNNNKFGTFETVSLLINAICARVFLNFPRNIIENSGTAAWIQIIYVSIIAVIFFTIIQRLYLDFENKNIIEIAELAGGSAGRVIVGMIMILLLLYICPVILREYAENMKIIALSASPISFVIMFFVAGMIWGAYFGIEAIARFHAIMAPCITVTFLFLILAVAPNYDFTNIFPILGNGADKIFGKGFFAVSTYAPLLYLFFLAPFVKTHKIFKRSGYIALMLCFFILFTATLAYSVVLSYPISTQYFLPMYQLARLINYGRFFQRIESVFMLAWALTGVAYLSIILFFIVYCFKITFNLDYHKPLIFPFSVIIVTLSLLPENLLQAINLETKYYSYFSWAITFGVTIITLVIAKARGKTVKKEDG